MTKEQLENFKKEYINLINGNAETIEKNLNDLVLEIEDIKIYLRYIKNICKTLQKEPKVEETPKAQDIKVNSLEDFIKSCYNANDFKETEPKQEQVTGLDTLKQELEKQGISCSKVRHLETTDTYQLSFKKDKLALVVCYFPKTKTYKVFHKSNRLISTKKLDALIKFCKGCKFIEF